MKLYIRSLLSAVLTMAVVIGSYCLLFQKEGEDSVGVIATVGDDGEQVAQIQQRLTDLGYYDGEIHGIYDLMTAEAIRRFQEDNGLDASGVCNPETLHQLGIFSEIDEICEYEEKRLLASALDALCPDGSYLVKVALAGVILKRVDSPGFPDNTAAVLFGENAFREIYTHDFSEEPSEESRSAVRDALYGLSPCPDALYFYRKGTAAPFLLKKSIKYQSGNYVFA